MMSYGRPSATSQPLGDPRSDGELQLLWQRALSRLREINSRFNVESYQVWAEMEEYAAELRRRSQARHFGALANLQAPPSQPLQPQHQQQPQYAEGGPASPAPGRMRLFY